MKHAMLDLETMGTNPGAIIISVAAVQFEPLTPGKIGRIFKMNISIEDSIKCGFRLEGATLKWWLEQRPEILKKNFDTESPVLKVLHDFKLWLNLTGVENLWGNSASFDCGLLAAYYRHMKLVVPWSHWSERCYRTVMNLDRSFKKMEKDVVQAHDPVYDCKYQIQNVQKFYDEILTYKP